MSRILHEARGGPAQVLAFHAKHMLLSATVRGKGAVFSGQWFLKTDY